MTDDRTEAASPARAVRRSSVAPSGLDATGITVAYARVDVVHAADLRLRPGRVTALVGPNGSGKSTLLRTLARLQHARTGSITLGPDHADHADRADQADRTDRASEPDQVDALALAPAQFARRVALLTQGRPTPGGLRVHEVVAFGRHPHRTRWTRSDPGGPAAVAHAMTVTGVAELAERPVDQLSGGQLQRVWLASCLAQETGALLLDEPTTYLDLRYQVELLDLVRDLADEHRIAVGIVLHDLDQAAAVADDVVLLADGRVVATGTPADVLTATTLSAVYGIRIEVDVDPATGAVRTRAVGRHHDRSGRLHPTP
ncbi:ABC transporter ATP-binding protein [Curtobacterium sp. MCBD17_019]|uniref:ABC transporter ATP-binding protein n=1 Tax=Curtobacterium sp. MCBD17_019 TaxID=2175669 RepID=UPI002815789C|nr:ABC transporter ATP-binding protein [Curtobacterium sp. MCBD17_019]